MKKLFGIALAAVIALFALAACGKEPSEPLLSEQPTENEKEEQSVMATEIFLTVESCKISVKTEKNSAVDALIGLLKQGDISYIANDYGGFEKVGSLGYTLPRSDTQMTTEAGDVVLYSGNQIVLFYGSNSWSYTMLGKMQGVSAAEVEEILTASNPVTVKISLQ